MRDFGANPDPGTDPGHFLNNPLLLQGLLTFFLSQIEKLKHIFRCIYLLIY